MEDIKEFYIVGDDDDPVETDLGKCHFIKVKEYLTFITYSHYLNLEKPQMDTEIIKTFGEEIKGFINTMPVIEMIFKFKEKLPYYTYFRALFQLCFRADVFDKLETNEDFEKYRTLIRDMNCVKLKVINPNPEIQKWIDKSEASKNQGGKGIGFKEVMTSVSVTKCIDYKTVKNMTVYQLFADFYRIAKIKGYDTSTLFATVATEKVEIEDWCANTDVEDEPEGLSRDSFNDLKSSIFG